MTNKNKTILIIDDHEDMLFMLSDGLQKEYNVITAKSASEGFEYLNHKNIQLIVSDVMMPEIDGFEFCKKIKSEIEFCHIPVILLTAKNTLQSKIEGLNVGADVYIEKPFSMEFLKAQIQSILVNRDKLQSHFIKTPTAHISSIASNDTDKNFLQTLEDTIVENMSNPDLDVPQLAKTMNMSRTSLYRKISSLSELSPSEIINITRLKKAVEMLTTQKLRLNEVADMVGYTSVTQLGRHFHKYFGLAPSEFIKKQNFNSLNNT